MVDSEKSSFVICKMKKSMTISSWHREIPLILALTFEYWFKFCVKPLTDLSLQAAEDMVQLEAPQSCYRLLLHSVLLCSGADSWKKFPFYTNTDKHTHTTYFLTSGFMNEGGGLCDDTECEQGWANGWWFGHQPAVCVMCEQTAPRAAVHSEVTARTGWNDLNSQYTHTHTDRAATRDNYCTIGILTDCLMISHPLRIVVTEALIQDGLIIASVYFYLTLTFYTG